MSVKIIGSGHYLPVKIITNDDLSNIIDTNHEWIVSRTGIEQRHIADDQEMTSDLACVALHNALKNSMIDVSSLDGIILATTTPDLLMPATAVIVQNKIGMKQGFAFDVQAVCAGFLYALKVAYSMIKAGEAKRIAVIGAEVMSRIVDWNDRKTCVLFGDGAGAVILSAENTQQAGIVCVDIYSDSNSLNILKVNGGVAAGNINAKLEMVGTEVFKFAVTSMTNAVSNILHKNSLTIQDIDWLVPHQANYRIMKAVAEAVDISADKIMNTVAQHANTSAASIPLAFSTYMQNGMVKSGDRVVMTAVGAGMTWGGALLMA